MKKIIYLITIVLLFIGCKKDFVDVYPTTSTVIETFYKTPENAAQAVSAIYSMAMFDDWWCSMIVSEIASDDCAGGGGNTDGGGYQRWDRGLQQPTADGNIQNIWDNYFGGIFRANVYLENEGKINWAGNNSLRFQYQAEARFLRAYYHFYLTRLFGEIPFLDHTLLPTEFPSRTPAADLYASIIDDLKFCSLNGLSANFNERDPLNWGRATKWAAEAMLGRVFLFYTGYYGQSEVKGTSTSKVAVDFTAANARDAMDDVINNSKHKMVPQFASLWRVSCMSEFGSINPYAGKINPEVVWSIRFTNQRGFDIFQRMIGPRNTNIDPYGQGWGAMPVLPTLWNAYDTSDTRQKATILNWKGENKVYSYVLQTQAQYTGYNCKKYEDLSIGKKTEEAVYGDWQTNANEDYMVIRFSDVLLMGAELHFITGDQGKALTNVNLVRERAFGDNKHDLASITLDDIYLERKLELACEGLRYFDILRICKTGSSSPDDNKLISILTYHDPADTAFNTDANNAETTYCNVDGNNFVTKKGLFQIPQAELNLMHGAIKQNPGFN